MDGSATASGGTTVRSSAPAISTPVALLAPTSRGGVENDMVGVEMGRANNGEPEFSKYCGPVEKFVSCPKAIPRVKIISRVQRKVTRIQPPACAGALSSRYFDAEKMNAAREALDPKY